MRIPSGVTDQYIYFVAVDATDLKTFETGLSSFTVRRSRNGGASAAFTTPTINETDVTNMPGVYELLLDEDMTIDAGDKEQEVCLRITHAGMAPVTRVYTLFRPDVTAAETITVSSGAVSTVTTTTTATNVTTVNGLAANVITAAATAADFGTEVGTAVWSTAARTLTALDEDTTTLDLDSTIRDAVGLAAADLDTQLDAINTNIDANEAKIDIIDTNVDSILVDTGTDIPASIATIDSNVDAILVDTGTDIPATLTTILADTNELQTDWVDGGRLDLILDSRASQTSVDTIDDLLDTEIPALTTAVADLPTNAELATALGTADDAVLAAIAALNDPTVGEIADAVWDETLADHQTAGSTGEALDDASSAGTPPTAAEIADEVATRTLDANIVQVNNITVDGVGTEADPWGP